MPSEPEPTLRDRMAAVDVGPLDVDAELRAVHARAASRRRAAALGRVAAAVAVVLLVAVGLAYVRARGEVSVASDGGASAPATTPPGTVPGTAPVEPTRSVPLGPGAGPLVAAGGSVWVATWDAEHAVSSVHRISVGLDGVLGGTVVSMDHPVVAMTADADGVYVATWDGDARAGSLRRIDLATTRDEVLTELDAPAPTIAVAGGAVWHGRLGPDGRSMLVRTALGDVPAGTDRSTSVRPMQVDLVVAVGDEVWAIEHRGVAEVLTVVDARWTGPSARVLASTVVDARATVLVAGDGVVWLGEDGRLLRYTAGVQGVTPDLAAPAVVELPGRVADVVDASDPLTTRAFVVVESTTAPNRVVSVATDDVLRTTVDDVPVPDGDGDPSAPVQVELLRPSLCALDPVTGNLWVVDVGAR